MPKRSAADLNTPRPDKPSAPRLLLPGKHLAKPVAAIFCEIRGSMSPGHFTPADRVLLEQLATAVYIARELSDALVSDGAVVAGSANQLGRHLRQQQATIATLCTKLRITAQARITKRAAARHASEASMSAAELYELAR